MQEELDAMKSKQAALKVEMAYQREGQQKEIEELRQFSKEQQIDNDKLISQIQRLQQKLKEDGKFNPDEDNMLSEDQINASKARERLINDAILLLGQLQPQAGIAFASQDPSDGIKVSKVHIGKAAYVASIVPGEVITSVDGEEKVDKEKFAKIWKSDAKAGSTLLLQVNGKNPNGKQYHRTVRMDLGSPVAPHHDIKALKRMADGVVKNGDDVIYDRVKKSHEEYVANGNNSNNSSQSNLTDERDTNQKGYLDENDINPQRSSISSPARRSSMAPTPSKSTTTPSKTTTTPSKPTSTPSKPTTATPSRSSLTSPRPSTIPSKAPVTPTASSQAKVVNKPSSTPSRSSTSTALPTPTTPRRTTTPSSVASPSARQPAATPKTSINATPTQRSAPPRGSLGPPQSLPDSRIMLQRRIENEKARREIADLEK
jgi:uncharacterized coiled-coil protein SlyX